MLKPSRLLIIGCTLRQSLLSTVSLFSHTHTRTHAHTHTHIHPSYGPTVLCPGLPGWGGTRTNLDFTEARDSEWQWHQLGHMQICTSPQTDNHTSTQSPAPICLQFGCKLCVCRL